MTVEMLDAPTWFATKEDGTPAIAVACVVNDGNELVGYLEEEDLVNWYLYV